MKKTISVLIVVSLVGTSCFADTDVSVVPESNSSEATAGNVAKHVVLSPLYVVFGAAALAKTLAVGTLVVGKTAVDGAISFVEQDSK
ncbi:hypothetical protein [Sulfurimonas sp.]|uniref:hypothetical protein n=1 Tax=Sulfurimonas sp. TaxID=2022749 RepID=UPI0025DAA105|nr:hypothetical protein [Sulfurimonas sp.]MBW6487514.1 hypothetical protein [Sulfurimonas sp.]